MDYEILFLFILACIGFYIKTKYGLIIVIFWLVSVVFNFFFTTFGIFTMIDDLPESEIFYISKKANYDTLYSYLKLFREIRSKFSLPSSYKPFGIFYDNPVKNKKNLSSLRSVIGIIHLSKNYDEKEENDHKDDNKENINKTKNKNNKKDKVIEKFNKDDGDYNDDNFRKYLKELGYKNEIISQTRMVRGNYNSWFRVVGWFTKISKLYISMTNSKFFVRLYNPEWKDANVKTAKRNYNKKVGILEIFNNRAIDLFIPLENEKEFNLYKE